MNYNQNSSLQVIGYANFTQRFFAFVIDCFVFLPFNIWSQYNSFHTKIFGIAVLITLAWCLYKPLMDWKFGGTIGKMVMKIRVLNSEGKGITLNQAFLRFSPYFAVSLSTLLVSFTFFQSPEFSEIKSLEDLQLSAPNSANSSSLILMYLAYLFSVSSIFLNEKKQAMHDKLANCYCILVRPLSKAQKAEAAAHDSYID